MPDEKQFSSNGMVMANFTRCSVNWDFTIESFFTGRSPNYRKRFWALSRQKSILKVFWSCLFCSFSQRPLNFTIARKSGKILFTYWKQIFRPLHVFMVKMELIHFRSGIQQLGKEFRPQWQTRTQSDYFIYFKASTFDDYLRKVAVNLSASLYL